MNNFLVYGLKECGSDVIRYIGYTGQPIEKRIKGHLREKGTTRKNNWIKGLGKFNVDYEIIEDGLTRDEAVNKEIIYIKLFKSFGADLVNLTLGGDGVTMTQEIRLKISNAAKGRKISEKQRKAHSERMKGRVAWNKGVPMKPDHLEKNRLSKIGIPSWNKGKKLSEKHKQKLANAKIGYSPWNKGFKGYKIKNKRSGVFKSAMNGKKHTPEAIEKMSIAKTGKKYSPETGHKRSESLKKYYKELKDKGIKIIAKPNKTSYGIGSVPWNKGKSMSLESKQKMIETKRKKI